MPFLEKTADITMSGRHVGDMSATFPAKVDTVVSPHNDDRNLMVAEQIASSCCVAQIASSEKGI
jgi:hypothetical protein